ncbi:MAG TPA: alpha/beta fold hydrolase [Macromonas sp.]|nr:alpha/beta fold hydrolase [Macromonas sp.]
MSDWNKGQAGKVWHWIVGVLAALVLAVVLGPRNPYGPDQPAARAAPPSDLQQLDTWLAQQEAAFPDIRPGTAKGVVWRHRVGQRTPWAVVYLHGFTASRLEVAPLPEQVAQALGANVYYTRLAGNGRTAQALGEATVQDWLADTLEALRIGRALGDKVLVIGTSTGGTLGTWLATRPEGQGVSAYVFISPNFGPKNWKSELINGPWGRQLALHLEGEERGEVSGHPRDAQAWTERYATRALFPMMALVKHVRDDSDLSGFQAPVLMFYSAADETVEPRFTQEVFARLGSAHKTLEAVTYSQAKGQHVLAGDLRDPQATPVMAQHILDWLKALP